MVFNMGVGQKVSGQKVLHLDKKYKTQDKKTGLTYLHAHMYYINVYLFFYIFSYVST